MPSVAIVTRNAMHGGVETMIALHQRRFEAKVFAAGGIERPDTCPFPYVYVDANDPDAARARLAQALRDFDVVLYHWPPAWAVEAIRASGAASVEIVHRVDTNDCDKSVPSLVVTHSEFLADAIARDSGVPALVIPHGLDVDRFPTAGPRRFVGGITSYYHPVKGLDLFFEAWHALAPRFRDQRVRFYGSGDGLPVYERMIADLKLANVELLGPVAAPEHHYPEFRLVVQPSRIEGLPFALLEALACGIPVICSDLPGMVEFNRLAEARGFAPPLTLFRTGDADDLARCMADLLERPPAPTDARRYVRAHYGADDHCRRLAGAIALAQAAHASRCRIEALEAKVAEQEAARAALQAQLAHEVAARDMERTQHAARIATRDAELARRDVDLAQREADLAQRDADLAHRDAYIATLQEALVQRDALVASTYEQVVERERKLNEANALAHRRHNEVLALSAELTGIKSTRSWRWLERYRRLRAQVRGTR